MYGRERREYLEDGMKKGEWRNRRREEGGRGWRKREEKKREKMKKRKGKV